MPPVDNTEIRMQQHCCEEQIISEIVESKEERTPLRLLILFVMGRRLEQYKNINLQSL